MLKHCESLENAIKLRAISNLLPSLLESAWSRYIEAIDRQLPMGWLDLTSQTLEKCSLASAGDTKKCKAFAKFQTERNLLDSDNITKLFANVVHSNWHVIWIHLLNTLLFFNNVFVLILSNCLASSLQLICRSISSDNT